MTRLAIFQHGSWEKAGLYLSEAAENSRIRLDIIKLWQDPIPDLASHDGLIILGGGPNVDEEERYPFLREEKRAIRTWLNSDRPCLGICLGHQLLADALGARIAPNFCHSIGFTEGHLTSNGRKHPLFSGIEYHFPLFKWHGQAVIPPVPSHFRILATSTECQVEAFTIQDRAHIMGIQFDNHAAAPEDVALWLKEDEKWLLSIPEKTINTKQILEQAIRFQPKTREHFHRIFTNFITMTKGPASVA